MNDPSNDVLGYGMLEVRRCCQELTFVGIGSHVV
jgi:hypothetical protein